MVVGDNGVLTQATNSADKTKEARAKEEVELAYSTSYSKYLEERIQNANLSKVNWFKDVDNFEKELTGTLRKL